MRLLALAAVLALPRLAFAYGEPSAAGALNHEERLLHVLTNQVRSAPHAWPDWDTSLATADARGPLALEDGLLAAARFHSDDMAVNDHFAHESSDGTSFGDRLSRFFSGGAIGENIYVGSSGGARAGVTGWMSSDGHRVNILEGRWNLLGTGHTIAGQRRYYVQDFGERRGVRVPPIPGGALEPIGGGRLRLLANWFDSAGGDPASFNAVLDGVEVPLVKVAGSAGNSTHEATAEQPAACAPLYFVAVAGSGATTVFPTAGALLAGRTCTETYTSSREEMPIIDERPIIDADDAGCTCVSPRGTAPLSGLALLVLAMVFGRRERRSLD